MFVCSLKFIVGYRKRYVPHFIHRRQKMTKKTLSKSMKTFIRREKARIRREVVDVEEQKKLINNLY